VRLSAPAWQLDDDLRGDPEHAPRTVRSAGR